MKRNVWKTRGIVVLSAALVAAAVLAAKTPGRNTEAGGGGTVATPAQRPVVELVFVLDTTGSMTGLIEGAKAKIWSIANHAVSGQPTPEVRIGLVAYRDKNDAYETRWFDLTTDLDAVYENLMSFRAEGGGDTPEHV